MGAETNISWCHHTWNPWWGCTKVAQGCTNCYAETLANRWGHDLWGKGKPRKRASDKTLAEPLKWNVKAVGRERVFCASMADVFDAEVPFEWRTHAFGTIEQCRNLDWLVLTKRPSLAKTFIEDWCGPWGDPLPHLWLGASASTPEEFEANRRILATIPAAVRWISAEPWIEPKAPPNFDGLDWLVVGGESGGKRREMPIGAARLMISRAQDAGVKVYVKQDSGPRSEMQGRFTDAEFALREFPKVPA